MLLAALPTVLSPLEKSASAQGMKMPIDGAPAYKAASINFGFDILDAEFSL